MILLIKNLENAQLRRQRRENWKVVESHSELFFILAAQISANFYMQIWEKMFRRAFEIEKLAFSSRCCWCLFEMNNFFSRLEIFHRIFLDFLIDWTLKDQWNLEIQTFLDSAVSKFNFFFQLIQLNNGLLIKFAIQRKFNGKFKFHFEHSSSDIFQYSMAQIIPIPISVSLLEFIIAQPYHTVIISQLCGHRQKVTKDSETSSLPTRSFDKKKSTGKQRTVDKADFPSFPTPLCFSLVTIDILQPACSTFFHTNPPHHFVITRRKEERREP